MLPHLCLAAAPIKQSRSGHLTSISNFKRYDLSVSMLCSVCQVPVAEGKSVQQTVDILHKKLEQLGATKQGSFCVDCETYHATGNVSGKSF